MKKKIYIKLYDKLFSFPAFQFYLPFPFYTIINALHDHMIIIMVQEFLLNQYKCCGATNQTIANIITLITMHKEKTIGLTQ